jgi:uncharacterized membrane protein YczE
MHMLEKIKLPSVTDIILAVIGAVLCGLGCGFINYASYGMDSIGLFYDGIRNVLRLSGGQIGTASLIVSFILSLFLWFADRKYVSFGSIIYIVMYGTFANLGSMLWEHIILNDFTYIRVLISALGLLTLYIGLGIYIAIDIGVDAFTGVMLWLCNITHKDMKIVKIIFDLGLTVLGFLLGGTIGIVTPVSILIGGPCISFFTKRIQAIYFRKSIAKHKEGGTTQQ